MTFLISYCKACKEQSTREVLEKGCLRLPTANHISTEQDLSPSWQRLEHLPKKGGISGWELPLKRSYHLLETHIKFTKTLRLLVE